MHQSASAANSRRAQSAGETSWAHSSKENTILRPLSRAASPMNDPNAARKGKDRSSLSAITSDINTVYGEIRHPRRNLMSPSLGNVELWPGSYDDKTSYNKSDTVSSSGIPTIRRGQQPRLLLDLESFVDQEFRLLNCPPKGPSEARIQVFRACFEMFIESFTTYKPLLSRIKQEYDLMLHFFESRIQQLIPMEVQLQTIRQEYEVKLRNMISDNQKLKTMLDEQKERCKGLEGLVDELRVEQGELKVKLIDLEKEYEESAEMARELEAKYRTLQSEYSEVMSEHREIQLRYEEKASDLERTRRLFDEMVPKEHLENSTKDLIKARTEIHMKNGEIEKLMNDIEELKNAKEATEKSVEELKELHTPRPDWSTVSQYLPEEQETKRTSSDLLAELNQYIADLMCEYQVLREKIENSADPKMAAQLKDKPTRFRGEDTIVALGTGNTVPKYLRYKGKVRNRHLPKQQVEAFIKEIMAARLAAPPEESGGSFEDYLFIFLQKKFGLQSMIAELGYSLLDSLKRFEYDADCELFLKILTGEVGEDVYYDQQKALEKLLKMFVKLDTESNSARITGVLTKPEIRQVLKKMFPLKSEEDLGTILRALDVDCPGDRVEYDKLFVENREGDQGSFIEEVRDQFLRERHQYLCEIEDALKENAIEGRVTTTGAKNAFIFTDPKKPKSEITELVCRAFKITDSTENVADLSLPIEEIMKNIRYGVLRRQSKKDTKKRNRITSVFKVGSGQSSVSNSENSSLRDMKKEMEQNSIKEEP